jgi:hypothetical protein
MTQPTDHLTAQLVRQLKIMNFWISVFGVLFLATLGVIIFMLWQMVSFVQDTNERIDALRTSASDSVNVEKRICESDSAFADAIKSRTSLCE